MELIEGGANVSETNVAQPWDGKVLHKRTPEGWPQRGTNGDPGALVWPAPLGNAVKDVAAE
jgi:hypothetical protein